MARRERDNKQLPRKKRNPPCHLEENTLHVAMFGLAMRIFTNIYYAEATMKIIAVATYPTSCQNAWLAWCECSSIASRLV